MVTAVVAGEQCSSHEECYDRIKSNFNRHEERLNKHSNRLDDVEDTVAKDLTKVIEQLNAAVKAIEWHSKIMMAAGGSLFFMLLGFFIWFVQRGG